MRIRVLVLLVNAPARVGCWPQSWCQCSHRYIDIWVYASILGSTKVLGHFTLNFNFERRGSIIVISANEDRFMYTLYFWTPCDQNMKVTYTLHQSVSIGDFSTHISYLILIVLFQIHIQCATVTHFPFKTSPFNRPTSFGSHLHIRLVLAHFILATIQRVNGHTCKVGEGTRHAKLRQAKLLQQSEKGLTATVTTNTVQDDTHPTCGQGTIWQTYHLGSSEVPRVFAGDCC